MVNIFMQEANVPAHLDIEDDIKKQKNGLLTFSLRVNGGKIVDYTKTEYVNAKKYFGSGTSAEFQLSVKRNVENESPVSHDNRE